MDCVLFVNNEKVAHLILLNGTIANIHVYMSRLQVGNKNIVIWFAYCF